ncbi:glycosyltransferase family protein [Luxibacter massiliensis]|uniref:hypothetical protein n=1 Tax=Luxibacter massiliensis TaxID=2219695 RepID=UPI000F04FFDD|nr:hypothetical protein [Luxibacter massiliensis]
MHPTLIPVKFRRIFHSNIRISILINSFFFVLLLLFCDLKYEVSDDFIMASILSGAFGESQNPQMIFVNVLIGYVLIPFYRLFPQISWYFLLQLGVIFASSTTITFLLFERMERPKAILLSVMLILFYINDAYILVQFTKTAMLAVMAGSFLFIQEIFHQKRWRKIIFGGLLCLTGTLIRFSVIYIAGGFIILWLTFEFVALIKREGFTKIAAIKISTIVLYGLLLISAAFGCKYLNWYTFNNDEAYGYFYAYDNARSQIVDYTDYGYYAYADELEKIGVSENDYYMLKTWNFADNNVFTLEKMQQVGSIIQNYQQSQKKTWEDLFQYLQARGISGYPVFLACVLLVFWGIILNYSKWWTMLASAGIGTVLMFYFAYRERCIYRVEYSVLLGVFICGIYFWGHLSSCDSQTEGYCESSKICLISTLLLCMIGGILYIPDLTWQKVTPEGRKAYIQNAFDASGDYDARKYRKVVNKNKPADNLFKEMKKHKGNFYFLDFSTTIQTLFYEWSPWESLPVGYYDNFIYLAGITTNFPDIGNLLQKNDLADPLPQLVKENVYVVDNCNIDLKLNYLKEHYYPDARAECVDKIDGYEIWKFYEK